MIWPYLSYITLTSRFTPTGLGYSDPDELHAINSLRVGDLGFAEVLVIAQDFGDVSVCANNHSIRVFGFAIADDGNCACREEGMDAGLSHRQRRGRRRKGVSSGYYGGGGFEGMCNLNGERLPGTGGSSKTPRKKTHEK
ncbi:hypothetical protein HOY80DRAFT_1034474 [Tuber brumale]|nr:hypothetical protein HOY80DRAFT_1034474 [Tuber brumale]